MYKSILRPILFMMDPERAHHFAACAVKIACRLPGFRVIFKKVFSVPLPNSAIEVCGLTFPGRIGLAAGFDKNADFYSEFASFGFSFIEVGTVTPLPQPGNPKPRLFRIVKDHAMINRMGFNNKGIDHVVSKLRNRKPGLIIGGNIGKNTLTPNDLAARDYAQCFRKLYDHVDYFVINISCPNIQGMEGLQDADSIGRILDDVLKIRTEMEQRKPVFLKISPDLTYVQIDEMIDLCRRSGINGIVAANTTTRRDSLSINHEKIDRIGKGGLSGNPLKERVKEMIVYICKQTSNTLPVIAVGGVMTPEDAAGLIRAGASLVQLYTGFIYEGPFVVKRINNHIENMLKLT